MNASIFLAQLIGPVSLVGGIAVFMNAEGTRAMAREFLRSPALNITKNAAIGKARRMELEGPRSVGPVREDTTTLSRLEALDKFPDRGCLYPIGHPGEDDFRFCGNNRDGGSYCLFHRRKAYSPEKMGKIEDAA